MIMSDKGEKEKTHNTSTRKEDKESLIVSHNTFKGKKDKELLVASYKKFKNIKHVHAPCILFCLLIQ